jgi:hypothetical protein
MDKEKLSSAGILSFHLQSSTDEISKSTTFVSKNDTLVTFSGKIDPNKRNSENAGLILPY